MVSLIHFLGGTCRAIRDAYYTPESFFTDERPLYAVTGRKMQQTYVPAVLYRLLRNAKPESKAVPTKFVLADKESPAFSAWHFNVRSTHYPTCLRLSDFKYTIVDFVIQYIMLHTSIPFFSGRPDLSTLNRVEICRLRDISYHGSRDLSTWPSIKVVRLQRDTLYTMDDIQSTQTMFPGATVEIPYMDRLGYVSLEPDVQYDLATIFANVQIDTLGFNAGLDQSALGAKCIQRAARVADTLEIKSGCPGAWATVIATELERRVVDQRNYRCILEIAQLLPKDLLADCGKYITHVRCIPEWVNRNRHPMHVLRSLNSLTAVRRIDIRIKAQTALRYKLHAPKGVGVSANHHATLGFIVHSREVLRAPDTQYILTVPATACHEPVRVTRQLQNNPCYRTNDPYVSVAVAA